MNTVLRSVLAFFRALWRATSAYVSHHWHLSRLYDALMRRWRGYGGFTGADRKGYSFGFFWRLHYGR